ncbi:carboxypeptidase-like regulatory domain-containing protein [Gramella jeungdoensis]|uniref:Carboxypeptidase-like regulatory domain-containing protein n=1 Tax=Gramella jeungdoensis TaxID=708091 RepID=A0ABT0Z2D4_9FLAO|nr:carboxypeptidase-like regulatory domain-containing protein [Gramella jeungdoensis]MCM8569898.1 carboxypeptidase-like regulatory domain-containing protein [Gramella jeungdoensis]
MRLQSFLHGYLMNFKSEIFIKLVSILVFVFSLSCKTTKNYSEYSELTGFENGKVSRNEVVGFAESNLAMVSGKIVNNNDEPIVLAEIQISNTLKKRKLIWQADFNGQYQINLEPGIYNFSYSLAGMDTIKLNNLELQKGELREIDISLGKAGTLTHYLIER